MENTACGWEDFADEHHQSMPPETAVLLQTIHTLIKHSMWAKPSFRLRGGLNGTNEWYKMLLDHLPGDTHTHAHKIIRKLLRNKPQGNEMIKSKLLILYFFLSFSKSNFRLPEGTLIQ